MMSQLAKSIGAKLGPEALPLGADGEPDLSGMFEKFIGGSGASTGAAAEAPPLSLDAVFVNLSPRSGIDGAELGGFTLDVSLGSTALRVKGLEIDIWGEGLGLLAPFTSLETFPISLTGGDAGQPVRVDAERVETAEGVIVQRFRFPELELALSAKARKKQTKAAKAANPFGFVGTINIGAMSLGEDKARICFNVSSSLRRAGAGEIHARVRLGEIEPAQADGPELVREASASATLEVRPAPRRPVLPSFVVASPNEAHYLEEYASRKCLNGWVGFAAPWSDVAGRVLPMIQDLVKMLRTVSGLALESAHVRTSGDESLTFEDAAILEKRDAIWSKIEAELLKGAEVSLDDTDRFANRGFCVRSDDGEDPPERSIALSFGYRRDGASPGWPATNVDGEPIDHVRVFVQWSLTRPSDPRMRGLASELSQSIVLAAGHVPGNVGGYVTTGSYSTPSTLTPPYEELMGLRGHAEKQTWCESHIRTPAWCVLAPEKAARRLAGRPTPARPLDDPGDPRSRSVLVGRGSLRLRAARRRSGGALRSARGGNRRGGGRGPVLIIVFGREDRRKGKSFS